MNALWDGAALHRLRELAETGASSAVIAAEFAVTRSSIIGVCHRNKIELKFGQITNECRLKNAQAKQNAIAARRREALAAKALVAKAKPFKLPRRPATDDQIVRLHVVRQDARSRFELAADLAIAPRHWETREAGECKFAIERNGETWSCCNATKATYCEAHVQVVYVGPVSERELRSALRAAA